MKRLLWFLGLFIVVETLVLGQSLDPIVMTVNGRPVYRTEFDIAYKKNEDLTIGKNLSAKDFMRSYIDYQLFVEEAYAQKMDTASDFRYQRSVYRSSVAADYMQDKSENYNRCLSQVVGFFKQDVELNHVLIPFDSERIFPSDTLRVYEKASKERRRLVEDGFKGESYIDNTSRRDVVRDYSRLKGYLGWVAPGVFPPAVEDALYSLSVGEISGPIRTSRGYHIVQVLGRRPSEGGRRVDHIYFAFSQIPPTQAEIDSVMGVVSKLLASPSVNFDVLCQSFSEAYKTGDKGCSFAPFGLNSDLPASFITAAYKLVNIGDVSDPIVSNTGVHLMRLVQKIPLSDEDAQGMAAQIIASKGRMYDVLQENHKNLFRKYRLKIEEDAYRKIEALAGSMFPTDSLFVSSIKNENEVLLSIEDSLIVGVGEFVKSLEGKVEKGEKDSYEKAMERFFGEMPGDPFVLSTEKLDWMLSQFALHVLRNHVYETLDQRYPEMRSKINVFAEELLVYSLKEKDIFSKVSDEKTLVEFFERNKKNYKWKKPRFKGVKVLCPDRKSYDHLKGIVDSVSDYKVMERLLVAEIGKQNYESTPIVSQTVWEKGDDEYVDKVVFEKRRADSDEFVILKGSLLKAPEEMDDVRSEVQADYQKKLEKEWIESLREKYNVEVNEKNLKDLK